MHAVMAEQKKMMMNKSNFTQMTFNLYVAVKEVSQIIKYMMLNFTSYDLRCIFISPINNVDL